MLYTDRTYILLLQNSFVLILESQNHTTMDMQNAEYNFPEIKNIQVSK
jgi:hypothetical protein